MDQIKLFFFPYGGGSAMVYLKWREYLDHSIKLVPVELAGRGKRFNESCYGNLDQAVADAYHEVRRQLDTAKFAFFGHSMGSQIGYELAHQLQEKDGISPMHLFFSGRAAPHVQKEKKLLHTFPEAEFCDEIFKLGGTPRELFNCRNLLDIYLPVLRADYRIIETYQYSERTKQLDCAITVFNGTEDDTTEQEMTEWQQHTVGKFTLQNFSGGHFFIHDHTKEICQIINSTLLTAELKDGNTRVFD